MRRRAERPPAQAQIERVHQGPPSTPNFNVLTVTVGSLEALLILLAATLVLVVPRPVAGVYTPNVTIAVNGTTFCGYNEIRRYAAWCGANVNTTVMSNSSCALGLCMPLEGAENMTCVNKTTCFGRRTDLNSKDYNPVAACLFIVSSYTSRTVLCDVDIEGSSIYNPPPSPVLPQPPPPPAPPLEEQKKKWPLWKTMTIIFSIIGGMLVIVIVVLLIRWFMNRRKKTSSTPVTLLTEEAKQKMELEAQGQGTPGHADATVTIRPVGPDGKPILAQGAAYPPAPSPLQAAITPGPTGYTNQLPPNAGDVLINASASSRPAYNGAPMQTAPVPMLPTTGVPQLQPVNPTTGGAAPLPLVSLPQAGGNGAAGGMPTTGSLGPAGAVGVEPPPAVMPAALVAPTAATLQNPTASS